MAFWHRSSAVVHDRYGYSDLGSCFLVDLVGTIRLAREIVGMAGDCLLVLDRVGCSLYWDVHRRWARIRSRLTSIWTGGGCMNRSRWQEVVDQLRGSDYQFGLITPDSPVQHVEFDAGLTDAEVTTAENRFDIRFPPDLREFLQTALPRGPQFPDWRSADEAVLRDWLERPRQGILFDIEYNGFWLEEWGPSPASLAEALQVASALVASAPRLIPIFMHRMMPDEPHLVGNPVFSVHQTDIIHYGFDLADYLRHEFHLPGRESWPEQLRPIRFWDLDRFQNVRSARGPCTFDNSRGELP